LKSAASQGLGDIDQDQVVNGRDDLMRSCLIGHLGSLIGGQLPKNKSWLPSLLSTGAKGEKILCIETLGMAF